MAPLIAVVLIQLACFGAFTAKMGFYHDDWVFLDILGRHPGFWNGARALAAHGFGSRPALIPLMVLAHTAGGLVPQAYQVILLIQDLAAAALLYCVLAKLLTDDRLAGLAAALACLYPIHPATHHWFANMAQTAALDLILLSFLARLSGLQSAKPWKLAASLTLYLTGLLCYEAYALLPLMLAPALISRRRAQGYSWPRSVWTAARELSPFAFALCLELAWLGMGIKAVFHYPSAKTIAFSPWGILAAQAAGFDCVGRQAVGLIAKCLPLFLRELGPLAAVPCTALSLFAAWSFAPLPVTASNPAKKKVRRRNPQLVRTAGAALLTAIAAAGFIGAWPLYGIAGYNLSITGFLSRTNAGGGMAAGQLTAAALWAACGHLPSRNLRAGLLAAPFAAFAWTNWLVASHWAKAWSYQDAAITRISAVVQGLPAHSTVIINWEQPRVFAADMFFMDEPWGLDSAIKVMTGRDDLMVRLKTPWMSAAREGIVEQGGAQSLATFPYKNLFILDMNSGELHPIFPPPQWVRSNSHDPEGTSH